MGVGLICCFKSQSTVMVMSGQSAHLLHFFRGKLEQAVNQYLVHIYTFAFIFKEIAEGRGMTVEIIL